VISTGYLGLGSNIGDTRAHLAAAIAALPGHGVQVLACSSLYGTEPVGLMLDQPDFLNACVRIETALGPEDLLDACKAVEREVGRAAGGPRHGPRVIDVDLLLLDDLEYSSERLTLPHAETGSRRFVLVPLLELDPALTLRSGQRLADTLEGLPGGQAVSRVAPPLM
jgi:2-amino-4-hydroxy-6-hydroxymethyldihydropteridine diphosphokinase